MSNKHNKQRGFSNGIISDPYASANVPSWVTEPTKGVSCGAPAGGYVRCYEKHPPLPLGNGLVVYGGSCLTPAVKDADVYIGLDNGMKMTPRRFPWVAGDEVYFAIPDGTAPKDDAEFVKLTEWTAAQILGSRKVHCGCIGGHGRTGLLLCSLARVMLGEKDAIGYVRKHYCEKVIETQAQVDFLHRVFDIDTAKPARAAYAPSGKTGGALYQDSWFGSGKTKGGKPSVSKVLSQGSFHPIASDTCLWGKHAVTIKGAN